VRWPGGGGTRAKAQKCTLVTLPTHNIYYDEFATLDDFKEQTRVVS